MATVIRIKRNKNENATTMLRRFSRKVKQASLVSQVRDRRYFQREDSQLRRKQGALARLQNKKVYQKLFKLGKLTTEKR